MLWRFKNFAVRVIEQTLGNFIPSPILLLLHCFDEALILFLRPIDFGGGFNHIEKLKVEKLGIFIEEGLGETDPFFLFLNE